MATTRPIRAGRAFAVAGRLVDLVLLGVITLGLTSVLLGRVLPAIGHPVFVVAGPSMVPAVPVGAAVALDAADPATLRVGDVVTLQTGPDRSIFTHRIIRIVDREDGRWIETKGDANPHADPSLTPVASILGRVGLTVPYAGYLLTLVSTIQGIVLLVSSGLALMLLGWWLDDQASDRRRRATRALAPTAVPLARTPALMPARAIAAIATASGARPSDTPVVLPARMFAAATAASAEAATTVAPAAATGPVATADPAPAPSGTISAVDLARTDPSGRRRRRRAELARSRP
jgi:signal peptidase